MEEVSKKPKRNLSAQMRILQIQFSGMEFDTKLQKVIAREGV